MIFQQKTDYITFSMGESKFSFLPTGDIYEFTSGDFLINQFQGNPIDGSVNNIYLRIYNPLSKIEIYPLLGRQSDCKISRDEKKLQFSGQAGEVSYKVLFYPAADGIWFWKVLLSGIEKTVDVLYGQDIGVASKGGVLTNELYMSQYLDHKILKGEHGFTVSSRQNLPQNGLFPYLQQGSLLTDITGFSTDAMQFFGFSYKATNLPEALFGNLPNENYQFELSYTGLQSEKIILNGETAIVFYGLFKENHPHAVMELEYKDELLAAYNTADWENSAMQPIESVQIKKDFDKPYVSPQWTNDEIKMNFPNRKLEEYEDDTLLSFFSSDYIHVVLQSKELLNERPHGHIITTKMNENKIDVNLITSTNYMVGIFNGQTVVGNTNFHKLLSTPRGLLNILKNSGQRIYLKLDGVYRILTLPAAYEMGINYAKWYYELENDTLIVTSFAAAEQPDIILDVYSKSGISYDFIITNQLVMGDNEFQYPVNVTSQNGILQISPETSCWAGSPYPNIHYNIQAIGAEYTCSDDRIFYDDELPRNGTLLTLSIKNAASFQLVIQGRLDKEPITLVERYDLSKEKKAYDVFYRSLSSDFHLSESGPQKNKLEKLNVTAWWYTHNAMTHFAVPHGLEQPGGAAWGTRDVCQGPMEYFLMTQHYELAKNVLCMIFSHQILESKEWPQWFMIDRYPVQANEWHGDVVMWPLKCVGDYVKASGDYSIFDEQVCYRVLETGIPTSETESILEHIKAAVKTIQNRFVFESSLISYAGGDWDDTLQPADEVMKDKLVSAWTVALAYQVIQQLGEIAIFDDSFSQELLEMADQMKSSFKNLLIKDGVIAGFAYYENASTIRYMLHPDDDCTGIHYRLLPMTRSIIAEIVDKKQADSNIKSIDKYLKCPDGIRLMDNPARYEGGVSKYFRRAEQAANVGREISLQYVHAHIRYIEAMAKMGYSERCWEGLFQVNPINIKESVPNAKRRQSNTYFSSSDGAFLNRYDYQKDFDKLRNGTVEVKGGWRLYSSGPGIYMNQLISNVLGIRFNADSFVIDPVLPKELDGLHFSYKCFNRKVTFIYHIDKENIDISRIRIGGGIPFELLTNSYRLGGVRIAKEDFLALIEDELHIYLS